MEDVNPHLKKYSYILLNYGDNSNNLSLEVENDAGTSGYGEKSTKGSRIFVPLCGKSLDMSYLASHPKVSHVVGIDIVRTAGEVRHVHEHLFMKYFS